MASDFSYLRNHYPQQVTSDQVRQMLHISKRKCAWMLQNGWIRCEDNGKKTRRYTIYLEDVIAYAEDSAKHPEKYAFPAIFSSGRGTPSHSPYPPEPPADLRRWLAYKWRRISDALTQREVTTLLGYSMDAVRRWLNRGWLQSLKANGKDYIPKCYLLDFVCAYGYHIAIKSDKHKKLLDAFFRQKD
jgi:hypothetical protein